MYYNILYNHMGNSKKNYCVFISLSQLIVHSCFILFTSPSSCDVIVPCGMNNVVWIWIELNCWILLFRFVLFTDLFQLIYTAVDALALFLVFISACILSAGINSTCGAVPANLRYVSQVCWVPFSSPTVTQTRENAETVGRERRQEERRCVRSLWSAHFVGPWIGANLSLVSWCFEPSQPLGIDYIRAARKRCREPT